MCLTRGAHCSRMLGLAKQAFPLPAGSRSDQEGNRELSPYGLRAQNGIVGQVHGSCRDGGGWMIRYLAVDFGGRPPGMGVVERP